MIEFAAPVQSRLGIHGKSAMNTRHDRIETAPDVRFGKPVIKGTRITVAQILRKLAAGMSPEQIVAEHPHLTVADIHAGAGASLAV